MSGSHLAQPGASHENWTSAPRYRITTVMSLDELKRLGDALPPVLGSEISMTAHSFDGQEPSAAETGEAVHNSVLIRTHEPARETHPWVAPTLVGVAILAGAIIWGVM